MFRRFLHTALFLPFLSLPAMAEKPVTAELLQGWQSANGTRISAIRLTLKPGWKTYWRAPGDAGIPPQFNWRGSRNLKALQVSWPAPKVFDQNGMRSIGYENQVILPLHITPRRNGDAIDVKLKLEIGVCEDICIPETLRLRGTLNTTTRTPDPSIAGALASLPFSASEVGAKGVTCAMKPISDGIQLTARLTLPPAGGQEVVVVEPGQPGIWVSQANTSRSGQTLTATVDMVGDGGPFAVNRSNLRFTVLGRNHAVDLKGCRG